MAGLFIALILSFPALASGPYGFDDPDLNKEFERNYYQHRYPNWVNATGSSLTISYVNVDSITLNGTNLSASGVSLHSTQTWTAAQTMTWLNIPADRYRRPIPKFVSVTAIDAENNTGTANQTCVLFSDGEYRCVTEDTGSTSVNRRFIITETASQTGTKNSGMAPGEAEATNTMYQMYYAKDDGTAFVMIATTNPPVQASFSTLNTLFGTDSWVYAGQFRNGDGSGATGDILSFYQAGPVTILTNAVDYTDTTAHGIKFGRATGVNEFMWSYQTGFSSATIQSHITHVLFVGCPNPGATGTLSSTNFPVTYVNWQNANQTTANVIEFWQPSRAGIRFSGPASSNFTLGIGGWIDGVLASGVNPIL